MTLFCPSRRIPSSYIAGPSWPDSLGAHAGFVFKAANDSELAGEFFDTSLASVEGKSLAIHRRQHTAGDLDCVSYRHGDIQLTNERRVLRFFNVRVLWRVNSR
jgi:hypothetical protein